MKRLLPILLSILCSSTLLAQSPYIHKVFDYSPAPGQFVNILPEYQEGDSIEDMRQKAEECLANNNQVMISLGGFGGLLTFGFDHMVENVTGEYDFKILGNAFFYNSSNPSEGGSSEPGIVMVSHDSNNNGIPDDQWYELAGSEYNKPETIHNYEITYFRPDPNHVPTPDNNYTYLSDTTYIRWQSNQGTQGYIFHNTFHTQPYFPLWISSDTLVFTGTKLANNYVNQDETGSNYIQYAYAWGYADNHLNTTELSNLKIDWAVDSAGNSVTLPGIHFVKVYTGVNQYCGWLGETSTEIMGATDLHLTSSCQSISTNNIKLYPNPTRGTLNINGTSEFTQYQIISIVGRVVASGKIESDFLQLNTNGLNSGIYYIRLFSNSDNPSTLKFVVS